MNEKTLKVLEYDKIVLMLGKYALSEMGKARVKELRPSSDKSIVMRWLEETSQAESIISYNGSSPMDVFTDIRSVLNRARIGSILSPGELLQVGHVLKVSCRIRLEIDKFPDKNKINLIALLVSRVNVHQKLMDEIFRCIEDEEHISDYATPELANIRRNIQRAHEKVRDRLNSIIRSPQFQKYLQDPIITIRNDRYVVPVKQEYRGSVPGLIHDQSSSGATLFIEPMSVVEINNELREWQLKEEKEVERILACLTAEVEKVHVDISTNLEVLADLDLIFARASLSRSYRGVCPRVVEERRVKIVNGRHPLISEDEVVPITVSLGDHFNTLVITGPNTGGKTVTLKTVGLFALMTQSGLHIPADLGTEMGIFQEVFADIGDEQSIEQSLSTFSSHMTNIANIVRHADQGSLVLFDELGAGTDPTEGAALAMAILDYFHKLGIPTIATTHYSELKVFAMTREGMENASMEFDVETLRPTYRLLIGIPGKSNAFEISRRLGLKEELIKDAKRFLSQKDIRFEDLISDLEHNRIKIQQEREDARKELAEAKKIREQVEAKQLELKTKEERILRQAREEARKILRQAKEESDVILKDMQRLMQEAQEKEKRRAMEEARNKLKSKLDQVEEVLSHSQKPSAGLVKPPKDLKPGEDVYIVNLDQKGQVLSVSDQGDEVQVQVGIMKINVHISNLRRVKDKEQVRVATGSKVSTKDKSVSMELDLRGQSVEEALINVDKYLDDVFLSGLKEVVLIHGKGTGVLRNGIHKHLRHHPHVSSFRLGKFGEGESGVTVVQLK